LAAIHGIDVLKGWGIWPAFTSGLFTASPLLIKEVENNTTLPVYAIDQLAEGLMMQHIEREEMVVA
jgi:hypothetical protein